MVNENKTYFASISCNHSTGYNIFSLGRYSIWKPGLMIDDVLNDIKRIENMINMNEVRRYYECNNY